MILDGREKKTESVDISYLCARPQLERLVSSRYRRLAFVVSETVSQVDKHMCTLVWRLVWCGVMWVESSGLVPIPIADLDESGQLDNAAGLLG